jgi:D-alanyl-D-alanine carboxypeptidase (penicillin-binding protein 5/6)
MYTLSPSRRHLVAALLSAAIITASTFVLAIRPAAAETPAALGDLGQVGAYVLADADTGYVLASRNERTPLPPASLTKVLTGLVVTQRLSKDAKIPVSAAAASMPARRMGITPGTTWNRDDALYAMMLASANDVSYALAEAAGNGKIEGFATQLDVLESRLNLADAPVLQDPSGLDDEFSVGGGNRISARDLAIVGRASLADPQLAPIMATTTYNFVDPAGTQRSVTNHNKMLTSYAGTNGLKTGYTDAAGRSVMVSATRNGRTLVVVLLDTPGMWDVAPKLLDYGFSLPVAQTPIVDRLPAVPGRSNANIAGVDNLADGQSLTAPITDAVTTTTALADATTTTVAATQSDQVQIGDAVTIDRADEAAVVDRGGRSLLVSGLLVILVLVGLVVAVLRARVLLRRRRRILRARAAAQARPMPRPSQPDALTIDLREPSQQPSKSRYDVVPTPTSASSIHGVKRPSRK